VGMGVWRRVVGGGTWWGAVVVFGRRRMRWVGEMGMGKRMSAGSEGGVRRGLHQPRGLAATAATRQAHQNRKLMSK
jgi:hypothetical protein